MKTFVKPGLKGHGWEGHSQLAVGRPVLQCKWEKPEL